MELFARHKFSYILSVKQAQHSTGRNSGGSMMGMMGQKGFADSLTALPTCHN